MSARLIAGLFLLLFGFYAISGPGYSISGDGSFMLLSARNLLRTGSSSVPAIPGTELSRRRGIDGLEYAKYAPGLVLAHLPMLVVVQRLEPLRPTVDGRPIRSLDRDAFYAPFTTAWLMAATVCGIALCGLVLGFAVNACVALAALMAISSPLWLYARIDSSEALQAAALIGAAYGSAGERCMAISAVVAVGAAGDPLVRLLEKKAKAIKVGAGDAEGVDMGPLVTGPHRDKVAGYVEAGLKEGARLVVDGRGSAVPKEGFFLGTSLFDYVKPEMTIYKDEIFGPVLVVLRMDTLDQAIELVNRNPYANGTAIFTESGGAARRFQSEIQVGMVGINVPIPVPVAFYSFGGWKSSLFGDLHVHGTEAVKFYTRTKAVTTRWPHQDTPAPGFNMPTLG